MNKQIAINRQSLTAAIRVHSQLRSHLTLAAIVSDWLIILSCIKLSLTLPSWPIYITAILIIASRQHAFLALMHEGAHKLIFTSGTLNDLVSNCFAAWPILASTEGYRRSHFAHHQFLNTDKDPDWARKMQRSDWQYPTTKKKMLTDTLKLFLYAGPLEWMTVFLYFLGVWPIQNAKASFKSKDFWPKAIYYLVGACLISYFQIWQLVGLYWFVPMFLLFPFIQKVRSVAEHFGLARAHEMNQTRNVFCGPIEAFFFGPHNIRYHLDHHLIASVPFYNLKKLHATLLTDPMFAAHCHENSSYIFPSKNSMLKDCLRSEPAPAAVQQAS